MNKKGSKGDLLSATVMRYLTRLDTAAQSEMRNVGWENLEKAQIHIFHHHFQVLKSMERNCFISCRNVWQPANENL